MVTVADGLPLAIHPFFLTVPLSCRTGFGTYTIDKTNGAASKSGNVECVL